MLYIVINKSINKEKKKEAAKLLMRQFLLHLISVVTIPDKMKLCYNLLLHHKVKNEEMHTAGVVYKQTKIKIVVSNTMLLGSLFLGHCV